MRREIKILLLSDTWTYLALGLIGPIYAIFVEKIGGNILDASWAYSSFMITTGLVMFFISRWEDKAKHKEELVVVGYVLTSLGCLSYIFVKDEISLVITQVILGLAGALYTPAFDALYSEYLDSDEEASEWGLEEAMIYVIGAISALIGGYVAKFLGFRSLFIIMFIVSTFSVATSLHLLHSKKHPSIS